MNERLDALHIGRNADCVLAINVSLSVLLKPFPSDAWENQELYDVNKKGPWCFMPWRVGDDR